MKLAYFDFGEPRILAASIAAMSRAGHEVFYVEPQPTGVRRTDVTVEEVDLGTCANPMPVRFNKLRVPWPLNVSEHQETESGGTLRDVDAVITGRELWLQTRRLSEKLECSLVFWKGVVPSVAKAGVFVRYGGRYSKLLTSPAGLLLDVLASRYSTLTVTNDPLTTDLLRGLSASRIAFVPPTYCRVRENGATRPPCGIDHPYAMGIVSAGAPEVGPIELRGLGALAALAAKLPRRQFAIVGTSPDEIKGMGLPALPMNLQLIGRVGGDIQLASLYEGATCVLCPILIPGFSNRLMESVFYAKATFATPLVRKFHPQCENGVSLVNLAPEDSFEIDSVFEGDVKKTRMEEAAARYYERTYSPEKHANALTGALESVAG